LYSGNLSLKNMTHFSNYFSSTGSLGAFLPFLPPCMALI
jgi:hypothetical protein